MSSVASSVGCVVPLVVLAVAMGFGKHVVELVAVRLLGISPQGERVDISPSPDFHIDKVVGRRWHLVAATDDGGPLALVRRRHYHERWDRDGLHGAHVVAHWQRNDAVTCDAPWDQQSFELHFEDNAGVSRLPGDQVSVVWHLGRLGGHALMLSYSHHLDFHGVEVYWQGGPFLDSDSLHHVQEIADKAGFGDHPVDAVSAATNPPCDPASFPW
eukprot:TRINITY_DN55620_c0_g1_i1.p1 TRINITY_DN55620_c0_g1~~TRINITY_DN55620_c0_g1_i1.p1  ORF type:complete len:214 (+),score=25.01 TRINITY_DN55620_c0_g1_i1:122-763(+)